ncbi:MAG TPA: PAS domain S-box protein, partial [Anaerolineae bacterium]|nr:PAS domain S-box protein [Anaerolineae bacterium]
MPDQERNGAALNGELDDLRRQVLEWENLYEAILSCAPNAIVSLDAQHLITSWNKGAEALFGYTAQEALGRNLDDLIAAPDAETWAEATSLTRRVLSGEPIPLAERVRFRKDGTPVSVLLAGAPILVEGELWGVVVVYTDITERKRAEAQLARRAQEMAALYDTLIEINSQPDLDTLLNAIVRRAADLVGTSIVTLYLLRPDGQGLELVAGCNWPGVVPLGTVLRLGEGVAGRVARSGEPLSVADYQNWEGRARVYDGYVARRTLGVPLQVGERVIGVITVSDVARVGDFEQDEVRLVKLFADQAAIAVENARLFRNVEQGKRDWEATFDAMQDAVVLVDRDYRILRANRAFAELVRCELPDLIHEDYFELVGAPADPMPPQPSADWSATWVQEYHNRICEIQATPLPSSGVRESDRSGGLILVIRDITARRRAEEEVRRRNRELTLLNRVIAASAAASRDMASILETVCRELAQAFDVPQAAAALLNQDRTQSVVVAEYRTEDRPPALGAVIPAKDNPSVAYLLRHKRPLVIPDAQNDPLLAPVHDLMRQRGTVSLLLLPLIVEGEVVGSLGVDAIEPRPFSDEEVALAQRVAEQVSGVLARARLEDVQRRLSAAVEQAEEAVLIVDTEGIVIYTNPAFERLIGGGQVPLPDQISHLVRRRRIDPALYHEILRAVRAGQPWQGRFTDRTEDNRPFTVDATVTPVRNQAGEIVNYVVSLRDVTREVELEAQFYHAQKMEALGRMAGGIAHDFNNLLTVIQLSNRLLERQVRPEDPLWEHVQRIRETSDRAEKLTRQLLRFSRREVVEPEVLDLNQVIRDLSYMLERIIGEQVELALDLSPDLAPVKIAPSQVDQLVLNLVVNACDAMPQGGVLTIQTVNVTVDESEARAYMMDIRPGDYVRLSIRDTGVGMDEQVLEHIFEPFFTTKERGQGTGLGLPTVFGIVAQNGGAIRVQSQVGQGSVFHILLPQVQEPPSRKSPRPSPSVTDEAVRGSETVLIAEDDPSVLGLAEQVLRSCGYRVLTAADGPEALRLSRDYEGEIHLLLTDVVMPQMSGHQLAQELLTQRPNLRVLYMSGYADDEIVQSGVRPSGIAFLPKPLTITDLTHKVRSV